VGRVETKFFVFAFRAKIYFRLRANFCTKIDENRGNWIICYFHRLFCVNFVLLNNVKNVYFSKYYSILCLIPQVVHIIIVSAIFVNFRWALMASTHMSILLSQNCSFSRNISRKSHEHCAKTKSFVKFLENQLMFALFSLFRGNGKMHFRFKPNCRC
jgi:hypothetical protein